MTDLSPGELSRIVRSLYAQGPGFRRTLQVYRPLISPFGELIDAVPEGARVLDAGCGGGLFLGLLAHFGRLSEGLGFDQSAGAIGLAEAMKERHPRGGRLTFERRDAGQSWPEGEFDAVSLIDVLHHVPAEDQETVFRRATARVAPGGRLLFKDMSRRPLWRLWAAHGHDLVLACQWIRIVPFDTVLAWAGEAGLTLEAHHRIHMLWFGHEIGIFRRPGND